MLITKKMRLNWYSSMNFFLERFGWFLTKNLVISFDYSWFLAKNLAYDECWIMKFHYRNSSNGHRKKAIWDDIKFINWVDRKTLGHPKILKNESTLIMDSPINWLLNAPICFWNRFFGQNSAIAFEKFFWHPLSLKKYFNFVKC